MVILCTFFTIIFFFKPSLALIESAYGRFPFLMPNVHPYRVSIFKLLSSQLSESNEMKLSVFIYSFSLLHFK